MRQIDLVALELSFFKSYRETTFIDFAGGDDWDRPADGLKFIGGRNLAEPRLEANGAGKTTIWDAVVWCLYGTAIKGRRASDLVSTGEKQPVVRAWLRVAGVLHMIRRSGNPDRLAIQIYDDDPTDAEVPIEQDKLNDLLGMDRERFLHSVIFGQGVDLLVDLPVANRGVLLDRVLDLGVWLRAAHVAHGHAEALERSMTSLLQRRAHAEGILAGLGDPTGLENDSRRWDAECDEELDRAIAAVADAEDDLAQCENDLDRARAARSGDLLTERDETDAQLKQKQRALQRSSATLLDLERRHARIGDDLRHFEKNHTCPTCKQRFPAAAREEEQERIRGERDFLAAEIKAEQKVEADAHDAVERLRRAIATIDAEIGPSEERLKAALAASGAQQKRVLSLVAAAEAIGLRENPYTAMIARQKAQESDARRTLEEVLAEESALRSAQDIATYWRSGFRRVRLFMIQRILSHLEIEVSNAADALGLAGWRIAFAVETETKSGGRKEGVQVVIHTPDGQSVVWELWSGGEQQRLRLAIATGFSSLIQQMAGVRYGFEVWDEPSAWLSGQGVDDLMEALRRRADQESRSVWVLDHRALAHSEFAEVWRVTKTSAGSTIERI